jgi:hypothetical protein
MGTDSGGLFRYLPTGRADRLWRARKQAAPRPSGHRLLRQNLPKADTPRLIILRSSAPELSNNIIQKGLAFIGDWSGTVVKPGAS